MWRLELEEAVQVVEPRESAVDAGRSEAAILELAPVVPNRVVPAGRRQSVGTRVTSVGKPFEEPTSLQAV